MTSVDSTVFFLRVGEKKCILRVRSLMPEQSEGNNYTSKINVFPVSHTIFFLLGGQKLVLLTRTGQQDPLYDPLVEKNYNCINKTFR